MAALIEVEVTAAEHIAACPVREVTAIVKPTRYCVCAYGETLTEEEIFEVTPLMTPMTKVVRACEHARLVVHRCPKCGTTRAFGGAA
jgi:hypothetical protein